MLNINVFWNSQINPLTVAVFLPGMLLWHTLSAIRSMFTTESDKDHGLFSTSWAKTRIPIQPHCHKIGPVHKWRVRKDSGSLPYSCKHRQRVFHGDKLKQMVEALLHGRD